MNLTGNETPREIIQQLQHIQWQSYTYEEFLKVLKRRLHLYTGRTEVYFFTEEQIVQALQQLDVLS